MKISEVGSVLLIGVLVAALPAILVVPNIYAAAPTTYSSVSGIRYVAIPQDISRAEVLRGGAEIATRLYDLVRWNLADVPVNASLTGDSEGGNDLVVVFVDGEGKPILPELESLALQRGGTTSLTPGALSFTFNSPSDPWIGDEQATLASQLDDFYREARIVYGDPAFNITVNIRKDPTIAFSGLYLSSINEMVLRNASSPDVLCHEMIHAFRDDLGLGLDGYEEGMTRAAEVEVFDRLSAYTHPFDDSHSNDYDVWYEGLNRQAIGSSGGYFGSGYVSRLLRYQLAGYAWWKVYIENENFFVRFNQALYARATVDPAVLGNESQLVHMAADVQPSVEGVTFPSWYANQFVLNTQPPVGTFLYQRLNHFFVDFFARDTSGLESMKRNAVLGWSVYDYQGTLLDAGSVTTSASGWTEVSPAIPADYSGRISVTVTANSEGATVADTTLRPWPVAQGVFGIVPAFDTGTLTITPLGGPELPTTVNVVNGAFSAPSLMGARGRFHAVFNGPLGQIVSKVFTKDASNYYLVMGENAASSCNLPEKVGSDLRVTTSESTAQFPSIAWSGSQYGIAWEDFRNGSEIWFARLDAAGNRLGNELRITQYPADEGVVKPSLVWTGAGYGLAWDQNELGNQEIQFSLLDADGITLEPRRRITDAPGVSANAALVWTGAGFGIAWEDYRDGNAEIYFARLDPHGQKAGADVRVTSDPAGSYAPALVWTGAEYGIAWWDERDGYPQIYFSRLDANGVEIGDDRRVTLTDARAYYPSLVWTGDAYGIVWSDDPVYADPQIYFTRLDSSGAKIGDDVPVEDDPASSQYPTVAWTGAEYGVTWSDFRDGETEVYFARLDALGAKLGGDLRVTSSPGNSRFPRITRTGADFGVTWFDSRDGYEQIYFSRVGCNCGDGDGDGVSACNDCNDANPNVHPGAAETCNGVDDNCDGLLDEDSAGADSDSDGIRNACDNCRFVSNPDQLESDGDRVGNACDNCVDVANDDQADADADGRGNACDNCLSTVNPLQDDVDSDQVGDSCDNCRVDWNPTQTDFDHDGEGDVCDLGVPLAENMNPGNDGSKYAWGENLGWINAQPSGPGGPGVRVSDTGLTGWMWAENAGWISLSCTNTSCATTTFGVTNNGCGTLSGYAWAENVGWIDFAPATCTDPTCGVKIDSATGIFSGRAWSENAGWITFGSDGPNPYHVETSWRATTCDDGNACTTGDACAAGACNGTAITAPPETEALNWPDKITFDWTAAAFATQYDVVRGSLDSLPVGPGGGDEVCFDDLGGTSLVDATLPAAGAGFWYLSRGENACGNGTYGTQGVHGLPGASRITTTCP